MDERIRSNSIAARAAMAAIWGGVCLLILTAPILASHHFHVPAVGIYFCFSCICHQAPGRVFRILGYPLAVCHRCCGIYLGFFLGAFIRNPWIHRSPRARRYWILAAAFPIAFDMLAPRCGLWTNTCWTRLATGLVFGIVTSSLLVQGIAEFLAEAPWRRFVLGDSHLRGGLS